MGADSRIQWTHHTFNPWWGCQRASPGCQHCYAETLDKRVGGKHWGPTAERRLFGERHWAEPLKWARAAAEAGERHRVFCASMADVFEDRLDTERKKLWTLIRDTAFRCAGDCGAITEEENRVDSSCGLCGARLGGLDWLLLTKRPENVLRMAPADILPLVWVGTTVEDQQRADERIPELLRMPARVRFLSMEPLLGPVNLRLNPPHTCTCTGHCAGRAGLGERWGCALDEGRRLDWVIVGGESGPGARPCDLGWARAIVAQCRRAGVRVFVKQLGRVPVTAEESWRAGTERGWVLSALNKDRAPEGTVPLAFADREKAGVIDEWPEDLRIRQFPEVTHV